jgi:hypothetical protein
MASRDPVTYSFEISCRTKSGAAIESRPAITAQDSQRHNDSGRRNG